MKQIFGWIMSDVVFTSSYGPVGLGLKKIQLQIPLFEKFVNLAAHPLWQHCGISLGREGIK